jgi:hypothetical protein
VLHIGVYIERARTRGDDRHRAQIEGLLAGFSGRDESGGRGGERADKEAAGVLEERVDERQIDLGRFRQVGRPSPAASEGELFRCFNMKHDAALHIQGNIAERIRAGMYMLGKVKHRAETTEEKEAIFWQRYHAYLREGAIAPNASERFA